jgi:CubicO group peptidase (beta-lactamase class C family)
MAWCGVWQDGCGHGWQAVVGGPGWGVTIPTPTPTPTPTPIPFWDLRTSTRSCTKSFLSALVGIAIEEGYLDLDDKVLDFFPDRVVANDGPRKQAMTVEHLLLMRSGLRISTWRAASGTAGKSSRQIGSQHRLPIPITGTNGGYTALGYGGQRTAVIPDLEMAVVITGDFSGTTSRHLVDAFIVPAARSPEPLPENPGGLALLEARIDEVKSPRH